MILYYTHNVKPRGFQQRCYDYHKRQAERVGQRFVAVVAEKLGEGDSIMEFDDKWPKYADIYLRILHGLKGCDPKESVYLCEDDTLYPDTRYYWRCDSLERVTYNLNLIYIGPKGYARHMWGGIALSQLMGTASPVHHNIAMKLEATLAGDMQCIEPVSGGERAYKSDTCKLPLCSVDFRTDYNASWKLPDNLDFFQILDGWPDAKDLWEELYEGGE